MPQRLVKESMATPSKNPETVFLFSFFCFLFSLVHAVNTITKGQSIKDGQNLVSVDDIFELGFFSPENSTLRYVGIRYYNIQDQAVIWIANRDRPILDKNGVLTIGQDGNLIVRDGNGTSIWSSNAHIESNNTAAILETTGNLILSSSESIGDLNKAYWQSFNDPTDTYLPNMKVLVSPEVGEIHAFTAWKSASDPSPGNFTMGVDPRGAPQIVIWEGSERRWRSGHWNGQIFTGVPSMTTLTNYQYGFKVATEDDGKLYITYNPSDASEFIRFQILWNGYEEQLKWNETESSWDVLQSQPDNECELYNFCGNFSICRTSDTPKCSCMEGFVPRNPNQWSAGNWSGGCVRRTQLNCQRNSSLVGNIGEDGFIEMRCMKLPDFADVRTGLSLDTCRQNCLQDCSCTAFALIQNIGCMTWTQVLMDVQDFDGAGNVIYLRLANSELGSSRGLSILAIVLIVIAGVIFLSISILLLWRLKAKLKVLRTVNSVSCMRKSDMTVSDVCKSKEYSTEISVQTDLVIEGNQVNGPDLPLFNFHTVAIATDNFSEENKLGKGGFGPVYKLPGGEEIAVKRLSKISGQGLEEFKNEMILIAKLQHRNLVRLLGCCIQGEEKILLYEYMPNKSLDCFLFDHEKQALLDWRRRIAIIEGIARGLLYLHRDSRLRIIHRDLKASNILLDEDMNPKISDFGMARIFGGNQNELNTNRVVGTYGYMSPEYAMEGLFSVKSDVYSFGVLLLEIVSGRRNASFRLSDHITLIAYAWQLWSEGRTMELVDSSIRNSCSENEVLKCIQVGMLCVQDSTSHRPSMDFVLLMLESDNPSLPVPRHPTFTSMRASIDTEIHIEGQEIVSSNDITQTMLTGR